LNYSGGIYSIIFDENYSNFIKDEELIVNSNQIALIDNKEWSILKDDIDNRNNNALKKMMIIIRIVPKKIKETQKEKNIENIGKNNY